MDYKKSLNLPRTRFPMKANLNQKEPEMLKRWEKEGLYAKLRERFQDRPKFILHDGPPYANGHIHLGHTINKVLKDIIVKSRQLMGYDAPYVPGWDCHGLPIEHNVEKELGPKKREMPLLSIRRACRKYAEKFVKIQKKEFQRLGVLGDWERPYLTMSFPYEAAIAREFCDIFLKGHVVKSKKPVFWCPSCITALAEAEVEYGPHTSPSITVKFPAGDTLKEWLSDRFGWEGESFVLIWTTTPWTLPANLAVAVHPDLDYVALKAGKEVWIAAEGRLQWLLGQAGLEQTDVEVLGRFPGAELEGKAALHPFISRQSPIVVADYVTLDTGTGCVHTAPGHGVEDYETGLRYGLECYSPVDDHGRFTAEVPEFQGKTIFEANPAIVSMLDEKGLLVNEEPLEHSYPHCWRCKKPVIFRATAQWFISMEKQGLRREALEAIDSVKWIPSWGKERIHGMVENRPDWCVSRQRSWGVPITLFTCSQCGEPYMTEEIAARITAFFEKEGADAWFAREEKEFLSGSDKCPNCGSAEFRKETDILDVWFDSGVSHAAVLEKREALGSPADLYLEGSDQHRGWFQSSLLTSVATRQRPPYRAVLTHGFVVDGQGKKMSKSVGNVIAPEEVIKKRGAEVLRLWVSAEDYRDDIKISEEILQRLTEAYRKIRNTIRFLLGNLDDFDPAKDAVDLEELSPLDRWALHRWGEVLGKVIGAYRSYEFHKVYHQIHQFCTVDMSALYLDILKDRLYCELADGPDRRSAQTVIHRITRELIIALSPILSFTAEEAWAHLPGGPDESDTVFATLLPAVDEIPRLAPDEEREWERLWAIRGEITKALEQARVRKIIGLALDARVSLEAQGELADFIGKWLGTLEEISIVSQMAIEDGPEDGMTWQAEEVEGLKIVISKAKGEKCQRCWKWSEDVGASPEFPDACGRCCSVLARMKG